MNTEREGRRSCSLIGSGSFTACPLAGEPKTYGHLKLMRSAIEARLMSDFHPFRA
jgi:hypothetical protein